MSNKFQEKYNLTDEQYNRLYIAIQETCRTYKHDVYAHFWELADRYLYGGKSLQFVLDVIEGAKYE